MTTTDLSARFRALGLRLTSESLDALLRRALSEKRTHVQLMEDLCSTEQAARAETNLERRKHAAALGTYAALDRFDWAHPKHIDREAYEHLATLGFIRDKQNVLFRGASGLGKTTLAKNLGHAALLAGFKVRFVPFLALVADLLRQESVPAFQRRLRRYAQPHLLIIDELGYLPSDARASDILYQVIAQRHETGSTIITTNLAYKQWGTVFPNATSIQALVDRFAQHCHAFDIEGTSWRHAQGEVLRSKGRRK